MQSLRHAEPVPPPPTKALARSTEPWPLAVALWAIIGLGWMVAGRALLAQAPSVAPAAMPQAESNRPAPPAAEKHVSARSARQAENEYVAGARALEKDHPEEAEKDFARASKLDPDQQQYVLGIAIAREHRVNQLLRQSTEALQDGNTAESSRLLAQASAIDPQNPMVQEHLASLSAPTSPLGPPRDPPNSAASMTTAARIVPGASPATLPQTASQSPPARSSAPPSFSTPVADDESESRQESPLGEPPALGGPIRLATSPVKQSFHFRSDVQDLLRRVFTSYGITPTFDSSVQSHSIRLDIDDAAWPQALGAAEIISGTFIVPLTEKSVLVLKDTRANRDQYERMYAETVFLPALTPEQMSDMGNIVRTLYSVKQATVQTTGESLTIRAPQPILSAINIMLSDLLDGSNELLLEMRLYEVDRTRTLNTGPTFPQQTSIFNLESEAASIISSNQSLIDQLIASGAITSGNLLEEIGALIAAGVCGSSVLCQPFATFGKGLGATGVGFNGVSLALALNSSAVRAVNQVQVRVTDHQTADFRNGTRYPIVTSTASYGNISGTGTTSSLLASLGLTQQQLSALGLGSANLSSLLNQPAPYPQVQYEDLGLTLKATPTVQKGGDVSLHLEMKLEGLTGASLDGNPVLSSRQYTSDITVKDGTSAILASTMSKTESTALSGLPGLSELPGFFDTVTTNDNAEVDRQELILVVTPHIVRRRKDETASPMLMLPMHEIPGA